MVETYLLMKITIIPRTYSMINGMTDNAGHQENGRLFKESKEPQNLFYVPDRKKNLVSISEMEVKGFRVALINGKVRRFFKDVFELRVVSSCKKSTKDHVH